MRTHAYKPAKLLVEGLVCLCFALGICLLVLLGFGYHDPKLPDSIFGTRLVGSLLRFLMWGFGCGVPLVAPAGLMVCRHATFLLLAFWLLLWAGLVLTSFWG